ncbi:MAG: T9SS type A sorting domain-containing protein [bacterium]|nr:T9SS type A sorting domain-containing protein [bacterium]
MPSRSYLPLIFMLLLICGVGFCQNEAAARIRINEAMSLNSATICDENGDFEDWVELYNAGAESVDLDGYYLSDDPANPLMWRIPAIALNPGAHTIIFASGKDRYGPFAPFWETVIAQGDTLGYWIETTAPPGDWREPGFDDAGWSRGPTGIGCGDNDDATVIETRASCFTRLTFEIDDPTVITNLMLHIDYDDAFVAFINGVEVQRAHIGEEGDDPPLYTDTATTSHEAQMFQGYDPESYNLGSSLDLLIPGTNVLAIQLHNRPYSSDLTLIPFLTLGQVTEPASPRGIAEEILHLFEGMHTNFKISSEGDMLVLSSPEGLLEDNLYTGALLPDISIGRYPDGGETVALFHEPTPWGANTSPPLQGYVSDPLFSSAPGHYSIPFDLELVCPTEGATIRYTFEGLAPDETADLYGAPISIDSTVVVRIQAFVPGMVPSRIITQTFIFGETGTTVPIISLTTDPDNLWDDDIGIYTLGHGDPEEPWEGANFWEEWERPVHVEYFSSAGDLGFHTDAGIRIFGGASRAAAQKSFQIITRSCYGETPIQYRIFDNLEITEFKQFILRNSGQDNCSTHFRDGLMHDIARGTDLDLEAFQPAVILLNGVYWGILNIRERQHEFYFEQHHGVDEDSLDVIRYRDRAIVGDNEDFLAITDFIRYNSLADPENYAYVKTQWDTQNFIEYNAMNIWYNNWDWPGSNMKNWRSTPGSGFGRWRYLVFDTDSGLGLFGHEPFLNGLEKATTYWDTHRYPFVTMLDNAEFTQDFINCMAERMNTNYHPVSMQAKVDEMVTLFEPEIERHMIRWGYTLPRWTYRVQLLRSFINERPAYAKAQMMDYFGLPDTLTVHLAIDPPAAGRIDLTSISVEENWSCVMFEGNPIKLTASGAAGFAFTGWSGASSATDPAITILPGGDVTITAHFTSAATVVINEINYNSSDQFDPGDWIEFCNPDLSPVDIGGYHFKDSDDQHDFIFPSPTYIPGNGYIVLCEDDALFNTLFPGITNIVPGLDFGFSGSGELLRLYDRDLALIDEVTYDDAYPWPTEPDGNGPTLELRSSAIDNEAGWNWGASEAEHGTPGIINSIDGVAIEADGSTPAVVVLAQAWPNPFNPRTTFRFGLPTAAGVDLSIYDIRGRLIERLAKGTMPAGWREITWEPHDLASGLYFCRLRVGDETRTQKVLLVK